MFTYFSRGKPSTNHQITRLAYAKRASVTTKLELHIRIVGTEYDIAIVARSV